jgi:hypothetical protein
MHRQTVGVQNVYSLKMFDLRKNATQNNETLLQRAMLCPSADLKNVVPHDSEICVNEIGFSKITEF